MSIKVALCQLLATDSPEDNLRKLEDVVRRERADLYVLPEMYLSSYTGSLPDAFASAAVGRLQALCRITRSAVCVGLPVSDHGKLYNSLFFVTDDQVFRYDKMHLARFGVYSEDRFTPGDSPLMVEWKGFRIGLSVCYDVMFPELHRAYGAAGADVVIVSSASLPPSRPYMERIVPARSLENTVYTVFVNNIGPCGGDVFFGGSSLYSPLGERTVCLGDSEEVGTVTLDKEEISRARSVRHHLEDMRRDVDWKVRGTSE